MSGCLTEMLSFICLMSINYNKLLKFGPTSALFKLNFFQIYENNFPLHFYVHLMAFFTNSYLKTYKKQRTKEKF